MYRLFYITPVFFNFRMRMYIGFVLSGMNCIKIGLPGKSILGDYFQREYDFPKTFSLTENQFSGKTYFYTIASRVLVRRIRARRLPRELGAEARERTVKV